MIVILKPGLTPESPLYQNVLAHLQQLSDVSLETHTTKSAYTPITEIYLFGQTEQISVDNIKALPGVLQVISLEEVAKRLCGDKPIAFQYQGLTFSQAHFHAFVGLNAVDNPTYVASMMRALQDNGITCTRMGAYKPRTSPYTFSGHQSDCLPYVFELAGKYGIKVIAMEVTHERHIEEIDKALDQCGRPTGVMLQSGTRNAQNFDLLRALGQQNRYPILYKRGFGISLTESISAAEYIAAAGNEHIIFCLRGVKSLFSPPHRNLVEFSQVPVVTRMTRMPVCVDPSHAVGARAINKDGICDVFHATAQGVIAGANMVLVDCHPNPPASLVDARQAISTQELPWFLEDLKLCRETYAARKALAQQHHAQSASV